MHLLFYRMRPMSTRFAIAIRRPPRVFAVAGLGLDQALLPEVIVGLGKVPLVRYATPGTPDLCAVTRALRASLRRAPSRQSWGHHLRPDLLTAFFRMETLEHFAKIILAAKLVGEPNSLHTRSRQAHGRPPGISLPASGGGAELPETCDTGESSADEVTLTRAELEALIDEAVRKDRSRANLSFFT